MSLFPLSRSLSQPADHQLIVVAAPFRVARLTRYFILYSCQKLINVCVGKSSVSATFWLIK